MRLNRLATRICASFFDVLCFFFLEHVSMKSRSFPGIMSLASFFDLFFRPFFYVWKGPKGAVYATSTRQKINTKSSTEAELVGLNDVLPQALWTKYFLQEQGYGCNESIIYQDNQSAMLLEQNGRASSSKRTRHINIRYYFVTDKIKSNEVQIAYCPTDDMIADFFTKPLQGRKFITFRNFILNIASPDAVTLFNVNLAPISVLSSHGCCLFHSHNHRSVLSGQPSISPDDIKSDWLLVTNRNSKKKKDLLKRIQLKNVSAGTSSSKVEKVENKNVEPSLILS